MAAFFTRVRANGNVRQMIQQGQSPGVNEEGKGRLVKLPVSAKVVRPRFFQGAEPAVKPSEPLRPVLAGWLASARNPYFARAMVNRLWGQFFGRGFVNPIDDFNDQNAPSNPELLNELAVQFKHYNYDLKKLIRWICNSNAYHLSCVANRTNDAPDKEALFGRMLLKAMSPEQLFDSLMTATNAEASESKDGKKALREQWMSRLIANFGDDEGNEVNFNGTVVQALLMMNGEDLNTAIARKEKGTVALAMARHRAPAEVIAELYLASLNRRPTANELQTILRKLPLRPGYRDRDPAAPYQDVFWALLNSNEFLLNH
jgi:hypothetical protein